MPTAYSTLPTGYSMVPTAYSILPTFMGLRLTTFVFSRQRWLVRHELHDFLSFSFQVQYETEMTELILYIL